MINDRLIRCNCLRLAQGANAPPRKSDPAESKGVSNRHEQGITVCNLEYIERDDDTLPKNFEGLFRRNIFIKGLLSKEKEYEALRFCNSKG